MIDVLEKLSPSQLQELSVYYQRKFISADSLNTDEERLKNPEQCRKPVEITDSRLWQAMSYALRLPYGTEILLNEDSGTVAHHLTSMVRRLR